MLLNRSLTSNIFILSNIFSVSLTHYVKIFKQISNEKGSFKVLKDGGHLIFTDKVNLKQDKDVITLQISEVS